MQRHHLEKGNEQTALDCNTANAIHYAQILREKQRPPKDRTTIKSSSTDLDENSIGELLWKIYKIFNDDLANCVDPFKVKFNKEAGQDWSGLTKQLVQSIFDFIKEKKSLEFILNRSDAKEKIQALGFIIIHSMKHVDDTGGMPEFAGEFLSMIGYGLDTMAAMLTSFQPSAQINQGDTFQHVKIILADARYTEVISTNAKSKYGKRSKGKRKAGENGLTYCIKQLDGNINKITLTLRHNQDARAHIIFDQLNKVSEIIFHANDKYERKQLIDEPRLERWNIQSLSEDEHLEQEEHYMKDGFDPSFMFPSDIDRSMKKSYIPYIKDLAKKDDSFRNIIIWLRLAAAKMRESHFFHLINQNQAMSVRSAVAHHEGRPCVNPAYHTTGINELNNALQVFPQNNAYRELIIQVLSLAQEQNPSFIKEFLNWCCGWNHLEGEIQISVANLSVPADQKETARSLWSASTCFNQIVVKISPKRNGALELAEDLKFCIEGSQRTFGVR